MRLIDVSKVERGDSIRLIGRVTTKESAEPLEVYFEFPAEYRDFIADEADCFVVALLVPAMASDEPLEIVPSVSPLLLGNLPRIRDIFHNWYGWMGRIDIRATARSAPAGPPAPRAATFFSGGVDSFYTLLKRLDKETLPVPLTHMIFMRGIESDLEHGKAVAEAQAWAKQIAGELGIGCIVGETNIRTLFPLHWEKYYFGSGLSATALALAPGFSYVCIPSSFSYSHQVAHGSTPLVDERFSTEQLHLIHDGSEATRAQKVARILEWRRELVLKHLRVCIYNKGGASNCGKCYKCVRTAVALRILGAWDDAETFANKSTQRWGRVISHDHLVLTEENLALAKEWGADPEITRFLETIVRRERRRTALLTYARNSPLQRLLPLAYYIKKQVEERL